MTKSARIIPPPPQMPRLILNIYQLNGNMKMKFNQWLEIVINNTTPKVFGQISIFCEKRKVLQFSTLLLSPRNVSKIQCSDKKYINVDRGMCSTVLSVFLGLVPTQKIFSSMYISNFSFILVHTQVLRVRN